MSAADLSHALVESIRGSKLRIGKTEEGARALIFDEPGRNSQFTPDDLVKPMAASQPEADPTIAPVAPAGRFIDDANEVNFRRGLLKAATDGYDYYVPDRADRAHQLRALSDLYVNPTITSDEFARPATPVIQQVVPDRPISFTWQGDPANVDIDRQRSPPPVMGGGMTTNQPVERDEGGMVRVTVPGPDGQPVARDALRLAPTLRQRILREGVGVLDPQRNRFTGSALSNNAWDGTRGGSASAAALASPWDPQNGFVSGLRQAIEAIPETRFGMSGQHVLQTLRKDGNVTDEELAATGVTDLLMGRKAPISRLDLLDHVDANGLRMKRQNSEFDPTNPGAYGYEAGGTRAFTGPRVPGIGKYFEERWSYPKKTRAGKPVLWGDIPNAHWGDGVWGSIRGSHREVPGFGKGVLGEELQRDPYQKMHGRSDMANYTQRPVVSEKEFLERRAAVREHTRIVTQADEAGRQIRTTMPLHAYSPAYQATLDLGREMSHEEFLARANELAAYVNDLGRQDEIHGTPQRALLDKRFRDGLLRKIDSVVKLREENPQHFEKGASANFRPPELSLTPAPPMSDDRSSRFLLKALLIRAAKSKSNWVAIPTGALNDKIQVNTYRSAAHYYDNQLAPTLQKMGRQLGGSSVKVEQVRLPTGRGKQTVPVYMLRLTPEMRAKIQAGIPMFADSGAPVFTSALERHVTGPKAPESAPAKDWKGLIANAPGVKKEEVEWSGINDWLDAQDGPVSKDDIGAFMANFGVRITEKVRGGTDWENLRTSDGRRMGQRLTGAEQIEREALSTQRDRLVDQRDAAYGESRGFADFNAEERAKDAEYKAQIEALSERLAHFDRLETQRAGGNRAIVRDREVKWDNFQLPGGKEYRELLLQLPVEGVEKDAKRARFQELSDRAEAFDNSRNGVDMPDADYDEMHALADELGSYPGNGPGTFQSSHWPEKNVLAHVRFNERTDAAGKKTLFIEEVQSDWHQKGREQGYRPRDIEQMRARIREIEALGRDATPEQRQERADLKNKTQRHVDTRDTDSNTSGYRTVPDAPFKDNKWAALAIKRMIRWASDHGYDQIAWTPGDVQNARYSLEQHADQIRFQEIDPGVWQISGYKNHQNTFSKSAIQDAELDGLVGREIADRMRAAERSTGTKAGRWGGREIADRMRAAERSTGTKAGRWGTLSGIDLKAGGDGMRAFYDKILPNIANDLGKKYGAKVRETEIETHKASQSGSSLSDLKDHPAGKVVAHALPITPELKAAAQSGQHLFTATSPKGWESVEGGTNASPTALRQAIEDLGGDYQKLLDFGAVRIVDSKHDIPGGADFPDWAGGVRSHADGRVYLIGNNLSPDRAKRVLLHEVGVHAGLRDFLGDDGFENVLEQVKALVKAKDPLPAAAHARAKEYTTRADQPVRLTDDKLWEETLAYIVEGAPDSDAAHASRGLLTRIYDAIQAWVKKTFPALHALTPDDLRTMAMGALKQASRTAEAGRTPGWDDVEGDLEFKSAFADGHLRPAIGGEGEADGPVEGKAEARDLVIDYVNGETNGDMADFYGTDERGMLQRLRRARRKVEAAKAADGLDQLAQDWAVSPEYLEKFIVRDSGGARQHSRPAVAGPQILSAYGRGMTGKQIAEARGTTLGNVTVVLSQNRKKLRDAIAGGMSLEAYAAQAGITTKTAQRLMDTALSPQMREAAQADHTERNAEIVRRISAGAGIRQTGRDMGVGENVAGAAWIRHQKNQAKGGGAGGDFADSGAPFDWNPPTDDGKPAKGARDYRYANAAQHSEALIGNALGASAGGVVAAVAANARGADARKQKFAADKAKADAETARIKSEMPARLAKRREELKIEAAVQSGRVDDLPAGADHAQVAEWAQRMTGVPGSFMAALVGHESAGDEAARPTGADGARLSSALGLTQITEGTFRRVAKKNAARFGLPTDLTDDELLELRTDPRWAITIGAAYAAEVAHDLQAELGRPVTEGETYIGYFMGSKGGADLIKAAEAGLGNAAKRFPAAASANHNVFFKKDGAERSAAEIVELQTRDYSNKVFKLGPATTEDPDPTTGDEEPAGPAP